MAARQYGSTALRHHHSHVDKGHRHAHSLHAARLRPQLLNGLAHQLVTDAGLLRIYKWSVLGLSDFGLEVTKGGPRGRAAQEAWINCANNNAMPCFPINAPARRAGFPISQARRRTTARSERPTAARPPLPRKSQADILTKGRVGETDETALVGGLTALSPPSWPAAAAGTGSSCNCGTCRKCRRRAAPPSSIYLGVPRLPLLPGHAVLIMGSASLHCGRCWPTLGTIATTLAAASSCCCGKSCAGR